MSRRRAASLEPLAVVAGLLVALGGTPAPAVAAPARLKLAVMEIRAEHGVDPGLARLLDDVILTQLSDDYDVVGKSDIAAMLGFEQQKAMLGCAEETSCLAEIGGALGVAYIVSGNIGQLGAGFIVNMKLLEAGKSRVAGRVSEPMSGQEELLVPAVQKAVLKLLAKLSTDPGDPGARPAKGEPKAGAAAATAPPPMAPAKVAGGGSNWLAWTGVGLGVVAVGGGAFAGVSALGARDDIKTNLQNPKADGSHLLVDQQLRATYGARAWTADVLVPVGLTLAVASFLMRDTSGAGGDVPALGFAPAVDGAAVRGSF